MRASTRTARSTAIPWPDLSRSNRSSTGSSTHRRRAARRTCAAAWRAARRSWRPARRSDSAADRRRSAYGSTAYVGLRRASSARDRADTPTASRARAAASSPAIALSSARRSSRDRGICAPQPSWSRLADSEDRRQRRRADRRATRAAGCTGGGAVCVCDGAAAAAAGEQPAEGCRAVDEESARISGGSAGKLTAAPERGDADALVLTLSRSPRQVGRMSTSIVPARPAHARRRPRLAGCSSRSPVPARSAVLALSRGENVSAAWLLVAALCTYAIAYRFYSAHHRGQDLRARRDSRDAGGAAERRPRLRADQPLDRLRPPLRGHRRPGPLVGPTLAAQFGYPPRRDLDPRRRRARRRRAGLRHPLPPRFGATASRSARWRRRRSGPSPGSRRWSRCSAS